MAQLAKLDSLLIDDFAIRPITAPERNDLLELLDDCVKTRANPVGKAVAPARLRRSHYLGR